MKSITVFCWPICWVLNQGKRNYNICFYMVNLLLLNHHHHHHTRHRPHHGHQQMLLVRRGKLQHILFHDSHYHHHHPYSQHHHHHHRCDLNEGERNYNVCFYMFSFMMVCALLVSTQIQFRYLSPKQVLSFLFSMTMWDEKVSLSNVILSVFPFLSDNVRSEVIWNSAKSCFYISGRHSSWH